MLIRTLENRVALFAAVCVLTRRSALRVSLSLSLEDTDDAKAQRSLPIHQDDSHLSLTIALNDLSEYDGGGTCFAEHGMRVVRPDVGRVVAFPGEMRHGGAPVTRGVRYIIAAFLWVSSANDG